MSENLLPVCSALALRVQRAPKPQNAYPSSGPSRYGVGFMFICYSSRLFSQRGTFPNAMMPSKEPWCP